VVVTAERKRVMLSNVQQPLFLRELIGQALNLQRQRRAVLREGAVTPATSIYSVSLPDVPFTESPAYAVRGRQRSGNAMPNEPSFTAPSLSARHERRPDTRCARTTRREAAGNASTLFLFHAGMRHINARAPGRTEDRPSARPASPSQCRMALRRQENVAVSAPAPTRSHEERYRCLSDAGREGRREARPTGAEQIRVLQRKAGVYIASTPSLCEYSIGRREAVQVIPET